MECFSAVYRFIYNYDLGTNKMMWWIKVLIAKADNLSFMPRPTWWNKD